MLRRPALLLLLLAPLVSEYLLGNLPLSDVSNLAAYPALLLLYGGGALLIREIAVRRGCGWPGVFLLAAAYGLIEEGLVTQSLFNEDFAGRGAAVPWAIFVLTVHSVWSIVVPIALVQLLTGRSGPWLRTRGIVGTALTYVVGAAVLGFGTYYKEKFLASPVELLGTVVVAVVLVVIAVTPRILRRTPVSDRESLSSASSAARSSVPAASSSSPITSASRRSCSRTRSTSRSRWSCSSSPASSYADLVISWWRR